ncbi:hypothetical protein [Paenibacillus sp. Leaf72]|uniref:hypothetical protein n=1 Tax=Paenibacillus sp. Leaf72 TaxID=1736234 RepID=UPI0012DF9802|nr:hypothetical protein [Paenibacillus sp. Leaf72]
MRYGLRETSISPLAALNVTVSPSPAAASAVSVGATVAAGSEAVALLPSLTHGG